MSSANLAWLCVALAGVLETGWAIALKYSQGLTKPLPSLLTALGLALSMFLLAKASAQLPIGTAYAVWVGIGAFGTAVLGIVLFGEPASLPRLFFLGLLLVAIAGLRLTSSS